MSSPGCKPDASGCAGSTPDSYTTYKIGGVAIPTGGPSHSQNSAQLLRKVSLNGRQSGLNPEGPNGQGFDSSSFRHFMDRWPSGKAVACRANEHGFESRTIRHFMLM